MLLPLLVTLNVQASKSQDLKADLRLLTPPPISTAPPLSEHSKIPSRCVCTALDTSLAADRGAVKGKLSKGMTDRLTVSFRSADDDAVADLIFLKRPKFLALQ